MNIIFSGWPASGGSTLAMSTAILLDYKYLYAGGLLKFLADKLYGSGDGQGQMQFENEVGKKWDDIWEAYAEWKINTSQHTLMEGKTAGFLIDGESIFRIMTIADVHTRAGRASLEGRELAEEIIKQRDVEVRQRWIEHLGIDVYDRNLINQRYQGVIDTSGMTLQEELEIVVDMLRRSMKFEGVEFADLVDPAKQLAELFNTQGKLGIKQKLEKEKLWITPQEILKEWNSQFPEMVKTLPNDFASVVRSYK